MLRFSLAISGLLLWCSLLPGYGLAAANYEESLKQLAEGIMAESAKAKKERLAIVDFTDPKGKVTPVGRFLAEELSTQLLVAGELTVVDRRLVNSTLKKLHIARIDATPPKSVKGAAKAIRADAFVVGSYLESRDSVLVTARLISPLNGQAVGATQGAIPKIGPLGDMLKAANTPPPIKDELSKDPPAPEGLGFHRNDLYEFMVRSLSAQGHQIRLEATVENRSPGDLKILCLLQNTSLKDEHGTQWVQQVEDNRDGLCTRGLELSPREKARTVFTFTAPADAAPASHFTLSYHEKSPRRDAGFFIEGLKADTPSAAAVSVTP
ncbi:FlgO family outer membrane protein [Nitrospira sp. NS4]|uniref:FlgO family outer membrane protein n=1 Tax=Nitrospira sp. NS4 TaxID=3414498 RepID=UPI003C2C1ED1